MEALNPSSSDGTVRYGRGIDLKTYGSVGRPREQFRYSACRKCYTPEALQSDEVSNRWFGRELQEALAYLERTTKGKE